MDRQSADRAEQCEDVNTRTQTHGILDTAPNDRSRRDASALSGSGRGILCMEERCCPWVGTI